MGKKVVTHKDLAGDTTAGKTLKSVETSDRSAPLIHAGAGLAHVKHGLVHGVQIFQHSLMKAVARGPEAPLNSVETRDKSAPQLDAAVSASALRLAALALCTSPCSFVLCALCSMLAYCMLLRYVGRAWLNFARSARASTTQTPVDLGKKVVTS